jgi:hypothetical protein
MILLLMSRKDPAQNAGIVAPKFIPGRMDLHNKVRPGGTLEFSCPVGRDFQSSLRDWKDCGGCNPEPGMNSGSTFGRPSVTSRNTVTVLESSVA